MTELAVYVRRAVKHYGCGSKKATILRSLNMSVPKGTIYGLLGASGCGKTTLLNCLVGRRKLDEGTVSVLGAPPGAQGSSVPGPRIGFMPQDIALVDEFTVEEMIYYFGTMFGMSDEQLKMRFCFLEQLLDLPDSSRFIENLSGGQKRRVSFAVALLSNPELLILDEPTVGLDPLLRQAIWNYLVETTANDKVTVIVTTHYIEEARGAHTVGLLREGQFLEEKSPQELLIQYSCTNLEDVFLKLCTKQGDGMVELNNYEDRQPVLSIEPKEIDEMHGYSQVSSSTREEIALNPSTINRMKALLIKNYKQILRNKGGLVFLIFFPILQMSLYLGAIGGDPKNLHLAIVNEEFPINTNCSEFYNVHLLGGDNVCGLEGISCRFLDKINDSLAIKDYYEDESSALAAIADGRAIGLIHFSANFSLTLQKREELGRYMPEYELERGEIHIRLDMTDYQIANLLTAALYNIYYDLTDEISVACNKSSKLAHIPILFNDPIYGERFPKYVLGLIPGNLLMIIYFLSSVLTSTTFITEKVSGVWDRNLVAGMKTYEILFSHFISQLTNVLVQCAALIAVIFIFSVPCKGNYGEIFILVYLQGIAGMCFGLSISVITQNVTFANYMSVGAFMPAFLLSGIIWPIEGMPEVLKSFSLVLPATLPSIAMRNIMEKGWSCLHFSVQMGYLINFAWIIGHCAFSTLLLKIQSN